MATTYQHDAAGNLTSDGVYTYQWDVEGRLTEVLQSGTAISTNTYDALGQRVEEVTPTLTTRDLYGGHGELLARRTSNSASARSFVPLDGRILAKYENYGSSTLGILFDHPDELGSISTATDYTGTNFAERLFYPFGESWIGADPNNFNPHQTFSQLPDYDPEIDEYNTANRHYNPMGRWMSPDPGGLKVVHTDDPQTWNMYAYVRNNPTTISDPSGPRNLVPVP